MQAPPALPPTSVDTLTTSIVTTGGTASGSKSFSGDPFAEIFLRLILNPGLPEGTNPLEVNRSNAILAPLNGQFPNVSTTIADQAPLQNIDVRGLPTELLAELTSETSQPVSQQVLLLPPPPANRPAFSDGNLRSTNSLLQGLAPFTALLPAISQTPATSEPKVDELVITPEFDSINSIPIQDASLIETSFPSTDPFVTLLATQELAQAASPPRLIEAFQPSPLLNPRYAQPKSSLSGVPNDLSLLARETAFEEFLPTGLVDRFALNESAFKEIDRLVSKQPSTDFLERGASVLTLDELRTTTSSPQDRNAAALARVDQQAFVDRIVQALERAHAEAPKRIEIDLNPPSLGQVKLHVTEQNGQLIAKLEVTSTSTRDLLLEHLPTLDRQLSEQGVQIQRFQVDQMNTADPVVEQLLDREVKSHSAGDETAQGREESRQSGSNDSPSREHWKGQQTNQDAPHPYSRKPREEQEGRTVLPISVLLGLADGMDQLV